MQTKSNIVRTEFAAAISQIAAERKISEESIYNAIKQALVSAFRKQMGELDNESYYFVELDKSNGESRIFRAPVTERDEETEEILARDEQADVTQLICRIGSDRKQVILQKPRVRKHQVIADYEQRIARLSPLRYCGCKAGSVNPDIAEASLMPPEEQMRGEFYRQTAELRF